jgi:transcriptional antiterminator NusG
MKKEEETVQDVENQDLLSDKEALAEMIVEGENVINEELENQPSSIDSHQELEGAENEDTEKQIEIYSSNPDMKWYIVYVRTGMEQKAKEQLEQKIKMQKKEASFNNVLVPTENILEISKGKKKTTKRKFFPGYMLVQMVMNEDNWHFVKSTSRVVGFVGNSTNPPFISEKEVEKIVMKEVDGVSKLTPKVSFEEGETVRVIEGPFMNFTGIVEEVRPDKAKLRVLVSIFGRSTPVELEFVQVEKM